MLNEIEFLTAFALTIVAVIVILAVVLSIAAFVNAWKESAARREYQRTRPKNISAPPPTTGDAYDLGNHAARTGVEFWRNPHVLMSGSKDAYLRWNAGWCYGKQQEADQ